MAKSELSAAVTSTPCVPLPSKPDRCDVRSNSPADVLARGWIDVVTGLGSGVTPYATDDWTVETLLKLSFAADPLRLRGRPAHCQLSDDPWVLEAVRGGVFEPLLRRDGAEIGATARTPTPAACPADGVCWTGSTPTPASESPRDSAAERAGAIGPCQA